MAGYTGELAVARAGIAVTLGEAVVPIESRTNYDPMEHFINEVGRANRVIVNTYGKECAPSIVRRLLEQHWGDTAFMMYTTPEAIAALPQEVAPQLRA